MTLLEFDRGQYHPVPQVIDAALGIFRNMNVREIADAGCGEHNLSQTIESLREIVVRAAEQKRKVACFVTGVPGSGKTLAGLTIAHDPIVREAARADVSFFSGNGPLVKVLREALVRDRLLQGRRGEAPKEKADKIRRKIDAKVQNVHTYARNHYDDPQQSAPFEHVVVFDEAQRAWNAKRNLRKFKRNVAEPEMVLSILDRHDWCVFIGLIGGGQEIYDGEAGLAEWGKALAKYRHWLVYAPEAAIQGSQSTAFMKLVDGETRLSIERRDSLQLGVSTRSFRSRNTNDWCNLLLSGEVDKCNSIASDVPVWITRELAQARAWLREKGRGLYRCGLVASSGAARLRPLGIETSTAFHRGYPFENWFLDGPEDLRSSYQLEVAATEFEVQGLELDFVGVCWGGDFVRDTTNKRWLCRTLNSIKGWRSIEDRMEQQYLINSYRVLLTRARQGTVIWVPQGDATDPTRDPHEMNRLEQYLFQAGARLLPNAASASA